MVLYLFVLLSLILFTNGQYNGKLPNIVFMLTDDLGWNSAYHNTEEITPTLDGMVKSSLVLSSFYVYKYCSPTRGSFLTGRFPYKLCATRNNLNPATIPEGINLGYTYISKKLQEANPPYLSYHVGKWHQGFFTSDYIPINRGFNKSYGFFYGAEDHFNQHNYCCPNRTCTVDLTYNTQPAFGKNGTYNGYTFAAKAIQFMTQHVTNAPNNPFFLYFPLHNTHGPFEVPTKYSNMYSFNQTLRNVYDGMETVVDESVKNITNALKQLNVWNNTLFVWTTDNGSPVNGAGSNYPFRGSKMSNWEGGVHVPALVTGGVLPSEMKGKSLNGLIHITDFYATFCYVAGDINPQDINPDAPSPIDSLNMWPYLSGQVYESPRNVIVHDHRMYTNVTQGAIRNGEYKLMIMNESRAGWYGQFSPNESWTNNMTHIYACSVSEPCLFDIVNDPTEHIDLSKELPQITKELTELFYSYNNEYHPPKKGPPVDENGFCQQVDTNKGFCGPWKNNSKVVLLQN
eukprot:497184_1